MTGLDSDDIPEPRESVASTTHPEVNLEKDPESSALLRVADTQTETQLWEQVECDAEDLQLGGTTTVSPEGVQSVTDGLVISDVTTALESVVAAKSVEGAEHEEETRSSAQQRRPTPEQECDVPSVVPEESSPVDPCGEVMEPKQEDDEDIDNGQFEDADSDSGAVQDEGCNKQYPRKSPKMKEQRSRCCRSIPNKKPKQLGVTPQPMFSARDAVKTGRSIIARSMSEASAMLSGRPGHSSAKTTSSFLQPIKTEPQAEDPSLAASQTPGPDSSALSTGSTGPGSEQCHVAVTSGTEKSSTGSNGNYRQLTSVAQ